MGEERREEKKEEREEGRGRGRYHERPMSELCHMLILILLFDVSPCPILPAHINVPEEKRRGKKKH